jgi:hypothetical protein
MLDKVNRDSNAFAITVHWIEEVHVESVYLVVAGLCERVGIK